MIRGVVVSSLLLNFNFVVSVSKVQKIASDAMYQVSINGYRLADVSHGKPYYVYCIEVLESESGARYFTERRYSEFSSLHRTVCCFIFSKMYKSAFFEYVRKIRPLPNLHMYRNSFSIVCDYSSLVILITRLITAPTIYIL